MSYFGGSSRFAGDPGFFGSLFGGIKGGVKGFLSGGPISAISGAATGFAGDRIRRVPASGGFRPPARVPIRQARTIRGVPQIGVIPATKAFFGVGGMVGADGMPHRRRRMNFANPKALRRATRRTDGFVRLAKTALKPTGFKVVAKSSGMVSRAAMEKAVRAAHHEASHH